MSEGETPSVTGGTPAPLPQCQDALPQDRAASLLLTDSVHNRTVTAAVSPILLLVILVLLAFSGTVGSSAERTSPEAEGVQITQLTNRLRVEINGQLFTEYYFKDVPRPYCYPLIG